MHIGSSASALWHVLAAPWRRASLRTKIHLSYLALISLPLLIVAAAAYQTSTMTIEQNAQDFSARLTSQIGQNLDTYERQAERLTYWPFQAFDVQAVLRAYQRPGAGAPSFNDTQVMKEELERLGHTRGDIAGLYVLTSNGTLFSWTASGVLRAHLPTTTASWYRAALRADPRTVFVPTQQQDLVAVATGKVFSMVAALHDAQGRRLGAVRVDIAATALANVVQQVQLGAQGRVLVVAPNGRVVYPIDPTSDIQRLARDVAARSGPTRPGRLQFDVAGQSLLATYHRSATSGWIVAGVVPTAQLLVGATHLRTLILSVAALCILAGALGGRVVVGRLTEPLRRLRGAMRRVEASGDLDTRIMVRSEDEVGQLAHSFNTMLDELRRLVNDVLRAQIHEREAELHALQNQINPHFLYNTLESINMLALTHDDREISRMVTSLGRLLRLTISATGVLMPLRDELDHVHHYLVVQRMRYGDRIAMTVDVDPALLDCMVPKLTLQPLVENALYHGLEPRRGAGCITVRGRREADDVVISVDDDGVGMDPTTLAAVQEQLRQNAPRGSRSVGLANVQQRLTLHCGPGYGLSISSTPDAGTQVALRLPRTLRPDALDGAVGPATLAPAEMKESNDAALAHRR